MPELHKAPFPEVTHQEVHRRFEEDGKEHKHFRVHLKHHDGTKSHVDVPDEHYTPEYVHALAQDEANRVMAVANLTDQPPAA